MKRPLLVGELNPYGERGAFALYPRPRNSSGHRLCTKIMGLDPLDYLHRFDRTNLCTKKWDKSYAALHAGTIKWSDQYDTVVLLGKKVCDAFGFDYVPFQTVLSKGKTFVVLPHPSGLCRTWNERGAYAKARKVLQETGVLGAR